jgi:dipeptidyl aminopeptidase/acylaminoacyl peptidase
LLFVDSGSRMHYLPLAGGEAQPLGHGPEEALAPQWAPGGAGTLLAFLRRDPLDSEVQRRAAAGDDAEVVDSSYRYSRLCLFDLRSQRVHQVSPDGPAHVWQFAWSPDGHALLAAVTATPKAEQQSGETAIIVYPVDGGVARRLCTVEGFISCPCWSPDGDRVAFLAALEQPAHGEIVVVAAAGGEPRGLLGDAELTATWLAWPASWNRLLLGAQVDVRSGLYALDLDDPQGTPEAIWSPEQFGRGLFGTEFSLDSTARRIAALRSGPESPSDVWVGDIMPARAAAQRSPRPVTDLHQQVRLWQLGTTELVSWQAADGLRLSGLLVLPPDYTPGKQVPLVVRPHGGPGMVWSDGFYGSGASWTHLLANQGIAVFMPNPRGGAGRGRRFLLANRGDLGGADYGDIMAGVDALIARGIADSERLGIGGWSYGGYMTAWAITQTPHFAAAVCGAGIVNWLSYEGQCDCPQLFPRWYALEDVYHRRERSVDRSPISHVANVQTPTLILQGAEDPRVPAAQAGELYQALRQLNVPVQYVRYPREGHSIVEEAHQLDVLHRVSSWFTRYLLAG